MTFRDCARAVSCAAQQKRTAASSAGTAVLTMTFITYASHCLRAASPPLPGPPPKKTTSVVSDVRRALIPERLLFVESRLGVARDRQIEQLLARHLLLDIIEVLAAPEVLHLHDR